MGVRWPSTSVPVTSAQQNTFSWNGKTNTKREKKFENVIEKMQILWFYRCDEGAE